MPLAVSPQGRPTGCGVGGAADGVKRGWGPSDSITTATRRYTGLPVSPECPLDLSVWIYPLDLSVDRQPAGRHSHSLSPPAPPPMYVEVACWTEVSYPTPPGSAEPPIRWWPAAPALPPAEAGRGTTHRPPSSRSRFNCS